MPPLKLWLPAVALGWLVPGGGHFLLKRNGRGALILFSVASMFLFGIMMGGVLLYAFAGAVLGGIDNPFGAAFGGFRASGSAQGHRRYGAAGVAPAVSRRMKSSMTTRSSGRASRRALSVS